MGNSLLNQHQYQYSNFTIFNTIALIHNSYRKHETHVIIPNNNYAISLAELLERTKCISGYKVISFDNTSASYNGAVLELQLLYIFVSLGAIINVHFISSPSRRKYVTVRQLTGYKRRNPQSIYVVNTNNGLLTGEEAVKAQIGGELICAIN